MKQKEGAVEYLLPSTLGIGLVKAYDRVGLENSLTKPHLRRLVSTCKPFSALSLMETDHDFARTD